MAFPEARHKMEMKKKAIILIDVIVAALMIVIFVGAAMNVQVIENASSAYISHRIDALNYASNIADELIRIGSLTIYTGMNVPPEFSSGIHTVTTNPAICTLPDSFFKLHLNGTARYEVNYVPIEGMVKACRVKVIVDWKEKSPKASDKSESLYIAAFYGIGF